MIWSICAFRVLNPRQWSLVKVISNDQNDIVGYLVGCFEDLRRFSVFIHIATWKQETPNLWNRSCETGNQTPYLLPHKPRA